MEIISYKCPHCSAPLSFDVDKQNWNCKFCNSEFNKDQLGQIETQGSSETVLQEEPVFSESSESSETYDEHGATAYVCPSCGGKIITDHTTAATFCVYCHNPTVIASHLADEHRPVKLIPFKLKKEAAVEAIQKLCKNRPLLPKDFREHAMKGEVSGLYVPFWLFSAEVDSHLQAQATQVSTWRDNDYNYTKTDTYYVERAGEMSFKHVPADGSAKMDDQLMESLEPFNYDQMVDFTMEYLSGHYAESYDVDANQVSGRVFSRIHSGAERMMRNSVKGYSSVQVTNHNVNKKNITHLNVMLPIWTLMTDYKGKQYIFAMNGQTGKIVGNLPLSMGRFFALFGGIGVLVSFICFIGGMVI